MKIRKILEKIERKFTNAYESLCFCLIKAQPIGAPAWWTELEGGLGHRAGPEGVASSCPKRVEPEGNTN